MISVLPPILPYHNTGEWTNSEVVLDSLTDGVMVADIRNNLIFYSRPVERLLPLFSLVPSLTVSAALTKIYGTDLNINPPAASVTGLVNSAAYGNVFTQDATTGTASLSSTGFAANAAISASPYLVNVSTGTLTAPAGYGTTTYMPGSLIVLPTTVINEIVDISKLWKAFGNFFINGCFSSRNDDGNV